MSADSIPKERMYSVIAGAAVSLIKCNIHGQSFIERVRTEGHILLASSGITTDIHIMNITLEAARDPFIIAQHMVSCVSSWYEYPLYSRLYHLLSSVFPTKTRDLFSNFGFFYFWLYWHEYVHFIGFTIVSPPLGEVSGFLRPF